MKTTKFKNSEIGPIPEEWEVRRLGEVVDINPPAVRAKPSKFVYVDLESVKDGRLLASNVVDSEFAPSRAQRQFTMGDVLYQTVRPYQCNNLYVDFDATNYIASTGYAVLRATKSDPRFIYICLHATSFVDKVLDNCTGTSYPAINPNKLGSLAIPVPPLAEQKAIAGALADVDELLAAMTTLIEKKRAIKQGAMQELLEVRGFQTGLTGFTGLRDDGRQNPVNPVNPVEKRFAPRRRLAGFTGEWVEKRFDDCFDLIGNNTYAREFTCADETGVANIHYGDVLVKYGSVLDFPTTPVDSLVFSVLAKSENLKNGDLVIADTAEDETVGKAVEIRNLGSRRAVAGLHTVACRPKIEFAPGWLGYYINSSDYHNQLLPLITGIKVSSISKAGFRQTVLRFPTLAEQKAIAGVLADMDAEIAALEAKRAKYEQIKQGMMQELLTGRVRLG